MWRRALSSSSSSSSSSLSAQLRSLSWRASSTPTFTRSSSSLTSPFHTTFPLFSPQPASYPALRRKIENIMPIATGHEREELEAQLQGRNILEINYPIGPFGTKEAPAIVQSVYHKRIVGCPGGEGEDEHDVVWFWLEKGKPHECPVCSQYFKLQVVGPGGSPDGH